MQDKPFQDGCAIVCGVSADQAFALGSLLFGFAGHHPEFAGEFVIFHSGLSEAQMDLLRRAGPVLRFRDFGEAELQARLHAVGWQEASPALNRHSPLIFAKFEMPDLLDDYEKCLWLDTDMLLQGPLEGLWSFTELAWRPLPEGAFRRRADVLAGFAHLRKDQSTTLPNAGVVGMARCLRDKYGLKPSHLYALAGELLAKTEAVSVDELALFLLASSRGIKVHNLEMRFNHPVTVAGSEDARIVHAIGPDKFWNSTPLIAGFPDWQELQRKWVKAGGTAYSGPVQLAQVHPAAPGAVLKSARLRLFWEGVYAGLRPELPAGLQVDLRSDQPFLRFFFAGRAENPHLRLVRHANDRRIRVELHFRDDEALGKALFARLEKERAPGLKKDAEPELVRNRKGWSYGATLPLAKAPGLIRYFTSAMTGALDDPG